MAKDTGYDKDELTLSHSVVERLKHPFGGSGKSGKKAAASTATTREIDRLAAEEAGETKSGTDAGELGKSWNKTFDPNQ